MTSVFRTLKQKIGHNFTALTQKKRIPAIWWDSKNWGDALSPVLIEHLSNSKPFLIHDFSKNIENESIFTVIGSILEWPIFHNENILRNTIIWGTGFMTESGRLHGKPRQICAVRGPRTRENIIKSGVECPEVYGDPALLYPSIYQPSVTTKYKLGIILHHLEKDYKSIENNLNSPDVMHIDIEAPLNVVVDQICSCQSIASSSLHGIIAADAYRVQSVYLKVTDKVVGNGYKFKDYFESVGRTETDPLIVTEKTTIDDILENASRTKIDIDLRELLDACPFLNISRYS